MTTGLGSQPCGCGCGSLTLSLSATFLPGHDAKLVSRLVRETIAGEGTWLGEPRRYGKLTIQERIALLSDGLEALFSKALAVKYVNAAHNAWDRTVNLPRHRQPVADFTRGVVKVGRWEYPARCLADGTVERNTKRDSSGQWVTEDRHNQQLYYRNVFRAS